ncbi:MAG TPA: CNNM domain-containing protein [Chthoniobacteraceae bacterium]|nr:CNNM domain-containing protein [Chthoniobacteraceae bacterium]
MMEILLLCLLVSFVFSGTEAGLLSLNRIRLRHRARTKDRAAIRLERLLRQPEHLLLTVVIVTNLMNIIALALGTKALVKAWGVPGYVVSLALFLPVFLFGVELFPKSLFRRLPYRALVWLAEPVHWTMKLLGPFLSGAIRLGHRMVPDGEGRSGKLFAAREDFKYFTIESERSGALSSSERRLIHNMVDFRTLTARDLMAPLDTLPTVPLESSVDQLATASRGGRVDQFLVTRADGGIAGMVSLLEALLDRSSRPSVSAFVRRLATVAPEENALRLLRRLRSARAPVLLVVEEKQPVGLIFGEALYQRMLTPAEPAEEKKATDG